jgi:hypothetical protein
LHASTASPNVVALERAPTNGISASMTVRWPSRAAVLRCSVMMARVAAEPQNWREAEAEEDAPARDRASVVSAARKMEKMAPRVPPHVSRGYI